MPAYYHDTPIDVPDGSWVRFDSDSGGTPAAVFSRAGQPIANSVVFSQTGSVQRVLSDSATLFLRLSSQAGVARSGVVAQTSGVAFTSFDSDSDVTGRGGAGGGGLDKPTADAIYAPKASVPAGIKTAAYTASLGEFVEVDISGGSFAVTLPAATGKGEIVVKVKAASAIPSDGSNPATSCPVTPAGTDTINGNATALNLRYQGRSKVFVTNGDGAWRVKSGDTDNTVERALDATLYPAKADVKAGAVAQSHADLMVKTTVALAFRHYAPFNLVFLGDSITEGQGSTTFTRRWLNRLTDNLRAKFPTLGLTTGGRGFIGAGSAGVTSMTPTWPGIVAGSPTVSTNYGPKRQALLLTTASHTVTYTLNCTSVDIWYVQSASAGTGYYSWDGGTTKTTFSTTNGTLLGGRRLRVTPTTPGANTLTVGWSSGGTVIHEGINEFNGDESLGIRVHDAGHSGYTVADWVAAGSQAVTVSWGASIGALLPNAIIITLGRNDQNGSVVPATLQTQLASLVAALRSVSSIGTNVPILFMVIGGGDDTGKTYPWSQYRTAIFAAAAADGAIDVIDLFGNRMPQYGTANATALNLYADASHPTDKGHSVMADAITQLIPLVT